MAQNDRASPTLRLLGQHLELDPAGMLRVVIDAMVCRNEIFVTGLEDEGQVEHSTTREREQDRCQICQELNKDDRLLMESRTCDSNP